MKIITTTLVAGAALMLGAAQANDAVPYEFAFDFDSIEMDGGAAEMAMRSRLRTEATRYCTGLTVEHDMPEQVSACTDAVVSATISELAKAHADEARFASAE